jgi:hypothetical protein
MRDALRETLRELRPDAEADYWQIRRREGWLSATSTPERAG